MRARERKQCKRRPRATTKRGGARRNRRPRRYDHQRAPSRHTHMRRLNRSLPIMARSAAPKSGEHDDDTARVPASSGAAAPRSHRGDEIDDLTRVTPSRTTHLRHIQRRQTEVSGIAVVTSVTRESATAHASPGSRHNKDRRSHRRWEPTDEANEGERRVMSVRPLASNTQHERPSLETRTERRHDKRLESERPQSPNPTPPHPTNSHADDRQSKTTVAKPWPCPQSMRGRGAYCHCVAVITCEAHGHEHTRTWSP